MDDIVVLNVGGQKHEVCRSVLNSKPGTRLSSDLEGHRRSDKNEYFFDRNSQAFPPILHFMRSGELHAPKNLCGLVFQSELEYWGIDANLMKECCWIQYCSDLENMKSLSAFHSRHIENDPADTTTVRGRLWTFLNDPHSSKWARVYAGFSVLVVLLSITVFCSSTLSDFQEDMKFEDYVTLYGPDVVCSSDYDLYDYYQEMCYEYYPQYVEGATGTATAPANPDTTDFNSTAVFGHPVGNPSSEKTNKTNLQTKGLGYPHPAFFIIDSVCVALFTLEFTLKLICAPKKSHFCRDPLNIIDMLAILPYFIQLVVEYVQTKEMYEQTVVDALYIIQIFRMIRIFKILRHFKGLQIFLHTIKHSWKEMVLLLAFMATGMVLFGSLIYYAEYLSGKDDIKSIPHGFWWAIVTMTTVGYGDVAPKSDVGFFIGSICAVMGVLFIAFSVPILVQNFLLFYNFVQYESRPPKVKGETNLKKMSA